VLCPLSYGGFARETVVVLRGPACRAAAVTLAASVTCAAALGGVAGGAGISRVRAHKPSAKRHACTVPGYGAALSHLWRPDMRAAIRYARGRAGDIAFAVRVEHRFYGYRPFHVEWSASVLKPMLMVAYLARPGVAHRALNGYDRSLLAPMITVSDNKAASTVRAIVGNAGLRALAARVGMERFATDPIWGKSHITAADQTRFFYRIDRFIPPRHRAYAMHLLASITSSQRWGIGRIALPHWHVYFKGGWGSGTGQIDHQVALLTRGCARASLAVLTMYDGSHGYGQRTLRGIFTRLLRGFPTASHRRIGAAGFEPAKPLGPKPSALPG
jgi:hypothetical protein